MPKAPAPSAELQDAVSTAVTAFIKAANQALTSVEETRKEELKGVLQDVREAQRERDDLRRERDALVQEKLASAVELEAAKGEAERWRTSAEKAEWMINHQGETIAQLRLEAQQWKDQFIRVDDERLRLSARNDELVSQQLYINRREAYYQEPLTPRSQGPAQAQSSSSNRAMSSNQFASSSVPANGYVTDGDVLSRRAQREPSRAQQSRTRGSRHIAPGRSAKAKAQAQPVASSSRHVSQTQTQSISAQQQQSQVLRTVHVVMQGGPTVKEESLDSVSLSRVPVGSASFGDEEEVDAEVDQPPLQPKRPHRRSVAAGKQKAVTPLEQRAVRRRWPESKRVYDEESESEADSASRSASEASEEDADEYVPSPRQPLRKSSRVRPGDIDEDEDELMLGGEAERHETYGPKKSLANDVRTPARRAQTQPAKHSNTSMTSVKKRNSPYPVTGSGKKARNR